MQYTEADIVAFEAAVRTLNQAIADGVRSVTLRGVTTLYNTGESLIKARNDAVTQLALARAQISGQRRPSTTQLYFKGRGYQ